MIGSLLDLFFIDGERINAKLRDNIVDVELLRSMEGASTLTMTLADPDGELLANGVFTQAKRPKPRKQLREAARDRLGRTRLTYGPTSTSLLAGFRLAGLSRNGTRLVLRWEDEIVAVLRQYRKPVHLDREDYTRAQFIWWLAHEPRRQLLIATNIRGRRIKRKQEKPAPTGVTRKSFTWDDDTRPTKDQVHNINLALEAAEDEAAGERATLALIEACIVEAPRFANPTGGHSSSVGILQLLDIHLGGSTSTRGGRRDVKLVSSLFLTKGFTGQGGAIKLARQRPEWTPGQIAQAVQGSDFPDRYEEHRREANDILAAYGGASGGPVEVPEQVLFRRGSLDRQPGEPREDSWQCMNRLAGEVSKRIYTANNILTYASDLELIRDRPLMTVAERPGDGDDGVFHVDTLDFDWDYGKPVSEVTFTAPIAQFAGFPGAVVEIRRPEPVDGRWLLWSIRERAATGFAEITLRRPIPPKPEPATTLKTVQTRVVGSARERILEVAKRTLTVNSGYNRYSQPGALTDDPTPPFPNRTDCSQWTRAVYIKAGLPDIGVNTWAQAARGRRTQHPQPGDLVFPTAIGHVEILTDRVGPKGGITMGHGTAPIDEWSVGGMIDYFGGVFYVTFGFLDE